VSLRIGVAVAAEHVRAVGVRRGRPVWALEAPVDPEAGLGTTLRGLLAAAPRSRLRRPRVNVALGPSHSQVKQLRGLPPLTSTRELARLVQQGAARFFLRNGAPLLTTGVRVVQPGEVWAAAIDEPVVREVEDACRAQRLRLGAVAPVAVALPCVLTGDEIVWRDGDLCLELRLAGGALAGVRRYRAAGPAVPPDVPAGADALAPLGEDAWRFADAYGAAMLSSGEALAFRPRADARVPGWRMAAASAVFLLSLLASQLLPLLAAQRTGARAAERSAALAPQRRSALEAEIELARVTEALAEIAGFGAGRRSATLLLGDLARALPAGSAVLTLRVDTAGGSLVLLSPRAAAVLDSLERAPAIDALEIAGPVTRESLGGRELERLTLRFRLTGELPDAHRAEPPPP
jgi:hypothetical protein